MRLVLLAAILFFCCASPALAIDPGNTANAWLQRCAEQDKPGELTCLGFIIGMGELHELLGNPTPYCRPPGVSAAQRRRIIVKYMVENPSKLHLPFVRVALEALQAAFPCTQRKNVAPR